MDDNVLVTVIMPVFNAERYLSLAIESVLNQTYKNFIFIIINDGSSDRSEEIILDYNDSRICYIKNERNIGIVGTLNKGLALAKTKYIARMDADDICEKERLEKQVLIMEEDDGLALLGTQAILIDEVGAQVGQLNPPEDGRKIKTALLFSNVFIHSSVMIRNSVLKENNLKYDYTHKAVEDYGLWMKIGRDYPVRIIPQKLMKYRINSEGIMANANKNQIDLVKNRAVIYKELFEQMSIKISDEILIEYSAFLNNVHMQMDLVVISKICEKLRENIVCNPQYDIKYFDVVLSGICRGNFLVNKRSIKQYCKFVNGSRLWKFPRNLLEIIKYVLTIVKQRIGKV